MCKKFNVEIDELDQIYDDFYDEGDEVACFQNKGISNESLRYAWEQLKDKPFNAIIEGACIIYLSKIED